MRLGDIWPERTAQPRAVRSRVLTSVLQGAPQWLRGLSVAGRVPHSGGPQSGCAASEMGAVMALSWEEGRAEASPGPGTHLELFLCILAPPGDEDLSWEWEEGALAQ